MKRKRIGHCRVCVAMLPCLLDLCDFLPAKGYVHVIAGLLVERNGWYVHVIAGLLVERNGWYAGPYLCVPTACPGYQEKRKAV